jgi:hypothetical protein
LADFLGGRAAGGEGSCSEESAYFNWKEKTDREPSSCDCACAAWGRWQQHLLESAETEAVPQVGPVPSCPS